MTEGFVPFGHLVRLFFAANGATGVVHRVDELTGEAVGQRLPRALARGLDEPAHGERGAAVGAGLDRDLICRATDAARLDFDERHRVLERELEDLDARFARGRLGLRERAVDDSLRGRALTALPELVVELRQRHVAVFAVGRGLAFLRTSSAWHATPSSSSGSGSWRRRGYGRACGPWPPRCRVFRGRCGTSPMEGPAPRRPRRGRRSAPGGCGRSPGCRPSPPSRWGGH